MNRDPHAEVKVTTENICNSCPVDNSEIQNNCFLSFDEIRRINHINSEFGTFKKPPQCLENADKQQSW